LVSISQGFLDNIEIPGISTRIGKYIGMVRRIYPAQKIFKNFGIFGAENDQNFAGVVSKIQISYNFYSCFLQLLVIFTI